MSNKQKKNSKGWMSNLVSICTLITLFLIMAQVFLARRMMIQSSEWEKAKVTIDNIERFKENLKETMLYEKPDELRFSDQIWPDFSKPENWKNGDTLSYIYWSLFEDEEKFHEDFRKTISILNSFAYPIIMGYASEMGSFQNAILEFFTYSNFIMPLAFREYKHIGHHAKLLYRLWVYKAEQQFLPNEDIEKIKRNWSKMLLYDGTEYTPASLKQYEKKLEEELKKIQKEIEVFRESSLK